MTRLARFFDRLRSFGSAPCIEDDRLSYTYTDLLEELQRWRSRIEQRSVGPGTVIAIRADYSLQAVGALFALLSRRAVVALIPRDRAIDSYLSDACAANFIDFAANGQFEWQEAHYSRKHPLLDQLQESGDGGVVLFTSGSTGRPKAALQSTDRLLYKFANPGRRFRTLAFLLFDHIAGLDTLLYTLGSGGSLIITRHRDPVSIFEVIESHKVEVLPASPSFLRLQHLAAGNTVYDLSSLKIITYGSEAMDRSTLRKLRQRFPAIQITQKYGTTETGAPKSLSKDGDSLWIKFKRDGVETKVVDGVLWIRSESTILGYLNAPLPIDSDGWYCTSDLVDVDGDWLRFRGRDTDIINVGGEKVAPSEVEDSILELDFVRDVIVRGEPNALLGMVVTARVSLVAPEMEHKEAVRRIWQHCRQRLAPYKAPVKIEITSDDFVNDRQKAGRALSKKVNKGERTDFDSEGTSS